MTSDEEINALAQEVALLRRENKRLETLVGKISVIRYAQGLPSNATIDEMIRRAHSHKRDADSYWLVRLGRDKV